MSAMSGFFQREYMGNPMSAYFFGAAVFAGVIAAFLAVRRLARRGPALAADLIDQVRAHELAVVALGLATRELDLPHRMEHALHIVTSLVIAYRLVGVLSTLATYAIRRTIVSDPSDPANRQTADTAATAAKGLIWLAGLLFVLSSAGYNVSSVVTGLGIGGVAVALGAQAVLGDLFSAVALYMDKPFMAGDFIQVGDFSGTVEHIGMKTTRVRSLNGELLVYPNSSLTSARIQNFRQMTERRSLVQFSVPLSTPTETLRKIPEQIRTIVEKTPGVRFDRAHLAALLDTGMRYEAAFYVLSPDYATYMDRQQAVLLGVLEALRADGIPLAQPTRSIVVQNAPPAA